MLNINWMILAYAGIFLAGLGVLVICISAARTLGTVRRSLKVATECVEDITGVAEETLALGKDLNNTVKKVEGSLEPILVETNILLQNTNILAEDLQHKSEKLDPLFDSAEGLASSVTGLQNSVENMKDNLLRSGKKLSKKAEVVVEEEVDENKLRATQLLDKFAIQEEIRKNNL